MSPERDKLLRLVQEIPDEAVPAVLADVRRRLQPVPESTWPSAFFGSVRSERTDTSERFEERWPHDPDDELSWQELVLRKGVVPVLSLDDMARPDLFDSDEDMEAFIAHVYASRRADLA